jgi:hypothetical protein
MNMAVDIPELDQPGNPGLLRTSWFPLVMTDIYSPWLLGLKTAIDGQDSFTAKTEKVHFHAARMIVRLDEYGS